MCLTQRVMRSSQEKEHARQAGPYRKSMAPLKRQGQKEEKMKAEAVIEVSNERNRPGRKNWVGAD